MNQLRKRLTYANVMSSLAVFLVLGGATAFAAGQLAKNSVGAKQLRKNAVSAAKIKKDAVTDAKIKDGAVTGAEVKDGSLTGADVNLATLGTVPSAATAGAAANLAGRTPISVFAPAGLRTLATVGPFTIQAECRINQVGSDDALLLVSTAVNGASMDDNDGDEAEVFNVADGPLELLTTGATTPQAEIETAETGGLTAVAPDGTAVVFHNETVGVNIAGHPGQCYFAGVIEKIG
ncbi:MAG TPA: hypothetical protein VF081_00330 [Solirubrobacterales bacterium]